jgi:acyl carrier protein
VSLQDELLEFLGEQGIGGDAVLDAGTPLFETGTLDSLALFNLVLWVEEKTGAPLDPQSLDLVREWASVRDIVAFVSARRAGHG